MIHIQLFCGGSPAISLVWIIRHYRLAHFLMFWAGCDRCLESLAEALSTARRIA